MKVIYTISPNLSPIVCGSLADKHKFPRKNYVPVLFQGTCKCSYCGSEDKPAEGKSDSGETILICTFCNEDWTKTV